MSAAELRARYIFNSMNLASVSEDVRKHLMILLLNIPKDKSVQKNKDAKMKALARLSGCITLPDDFDYKKDLGDAIEYCVYQ